MKLDTTQLRFLVICSKSNLCTNLDGHLLNWATMITGIRREEKEERKLNFLFRKKSKATDVWIALHSLHPRDQPANSATCLGWCSVALLILDKITRYWDHLSSLTTRFIKLSLQNSFRPFAFNLNLFRLLDHHIIFKEQVLYNWKIPLGPFPWLGMNLFGE